MTENFDLQEMPDSAPISEHIEMLLKQLQNDHKLDEPLHGMIFIAQSKAPLDLSVGDYDCYVSIMDQPEQIVNHILTLVSQLDPHDQQRLLFELMMAGGQSNVVPT